MFLFYKPPKHPKGIPWHEAIRDLDYIGTAIIVPGICLTLVGIINTTYKPSSDPTVVGPMVVGFVMIAAFGVWETLSNVKHKLCPPHLFKSHKGREFTAPFIVAFIVTMFYYSVNIIWVSLSHSFHIQWGYFYFPILPFRMLITRSRQWSTSFTLRLPHLVP